MGNFDDKKNSTTENSEVKPSQEWITWTTENLERGCDAEEVAGILKENNFSSAAIKQMMGSRLPNSFPADEADSIYQKLAQIPNRAGLNIIENNKLQICSINNFLSNEECDEVIKIIDSKFRPSEISVKDPDKYFRTSSTCDLGALDFPIVKKIEERISSLIGISASYGEQLQAQKYLVDQQFKAHTDYFEPNSEEYEKFCKKLGNRTWTFMIYLNEVAEGGHTDFSEIGHSFSPIKGQAITWNNLDSFGNPNYNSLHSGNPVTKGEKMVLTKWFREKGDGEMLI